MGGCGGGRGGIFLVPGVVVVVVVLVDMILGQLLHCDLVNALVRGEG